MTKRRPQKRKTQVRIHPRTVSFPVLVPRAAGVVVLAMRMTLLAPLPLKASGQVLQTETRGMDGEQAPRHRPRGPRVYPTLPIRRMARAALATPEPLPRHLLTLLYTTLRAPPLPMTQHTVLRALRMGTSSITSRIHLLGCLDSRRT